MNQPTAQPSSIVFDKRPPGVFAGKIPSVSAFAVAILLFLLPFAEIRCGSTPLTTKSGLDFALENKWKPAGGYGKEFMGEMTTKTTGQKEGNSRWFALAALALGVIGLLTCFAGARSAGSAGIVCAVLAAGALIALMVDLKRWFDNLLAKEAAEKAKSGADSLGVDKLGNVNPTLAFTPWSYIAIILFLAAAFFCYRRMTENRT